MIKDWIMVIDKNDTMCAIEDDHKGTYSALLKKKDLKVVAFGSFHAAAHAVDYAEAIVRR